MVSDVGATLHPHVDFWISDVLFIQHVLACFDGIVSMLAIMEDHLGQTFKDQRLT